MKQILHFDPEQNAEDGTASFDSTFKVKNIS